MEKHGTGVVQAVPIRPLAVEEVNAKLSQFMCALGDAVDSPKAHLILRNVALMLLELGEHVLDFEKAYELITDDRVRASAVKKLSEETPPFWSEGWDALWRKDVDPLLSEEQQRVAKRISLVTFWGKEWDGMPPEVRRHVANALKVISSGK